MKKRIDYIDFFRGIGIILMIMAHVGFGTFFDSFIHAFHMPMWFFVTGLFLSTNTTTSSHILSRIKKLLLPHLFGISIIYIIWSVCIEKIDVSLAYLLVYDNEGLCHVTAPCWFLTALFIADILSYVVNKYFPKGLSSLAAFLIALIGCNYHLLFGKHAPFAVDAGLVGVGIIQIAHILKKSKIGQRILNLKIVETLIGVVVFSVLIILNGKINMRVGDYRCTPLFWVNAIGFSVVLLNICRYIAIFVDRIQHRGIHLIFDSVKDIGENSLFYLILNVPIIQLVFMLPYDLVSDGGAICQLIFNIFATIVTLIIIFPVGMLANRLSKRKH